MSRTIEQQRGTGKRVDGRGGRGVAPIIARRQRGESIRDLAAPAEVRCECGSLMARLVDNRIELKCRRCKRVVVVATDRASRGWVAVPEGGCNP